MYSQEGKNRFFVHGGFGFNYSKSDVAKSVPNVSGSTSTSITTSLTGGYKITEKFATGLNLELTVTNTNYDEGFLEYYKMHQYRISPFVRYYVKSNFFAQAQVNLGLSNTRYKYTELEDDIFLINNIQKTTSSISGYELGIGYDIKITDHVYVEPMISYLSDKLNDREPSDLDVMQKEIFFNIGLIVFL